MCNLHPHVIFDLILEEDYIIDLSFVRNSMIRQTDVKKQVHIHHCTKFVMMNLFLILMRMVS